MWAGFARCTAQHVTAVTLPQSMKSKTSLESAQAFSVTLEEAFGVCGGLCKPWWIVIAHGTVSHIPQPTVFWKKTSCFFICVCYLSGTKAASSSPRWPYDLSIPVKSAPLPSALASFLCCGPSSPELLLLCESEGVGQSRHMTSCGRERTNISGWGEVRQESSGKGLGRLNLKTERVAQMPDLLFCFSKAGTPGCLEVSCFKPMLI